MFAIHSVAVIWRFAAAFLLVALVSGCPGGGSAGLTRVSGTVTYNGQPLKQGTITFMPVAGTNSSSGEIADGKYSLTTFSEGDGVPPGDYLVSVTAWEKLPTMTEPGVPAVPTKYHATNTSGLKATVTSEGSQEIKFDLRP